MLTLSFALLGARRAPQRGLHQSCKGEAAIAAKRSREMLNLRSGKEAVFASIREKKEEKKKDSSGKARKR